jgi:hypothetical protein
MKIQLPEEEIKQAIQTLKNEYGIAPINGEFLIATDIDGDLRIAPFDKLLWEKDKINPNNFIKIKDLLRDINNGIDKASIKIAESKILNSHYV